MKRHSVKLWNPRFTRRIVFLEKLSRSQQWFNATEKVTLQHKLELWASKDLSLKEASHHQTCSNRPTDKTRLKWRLIWSRLHLFTLFNWHQCTVKNCLITTTKPEVLPKIYFPEENHFLARSTVVCNTQHTSICPSIHKKSWCEICLHAPLRLCYDSEASTNWSSRFKSPEFKFRCNLRVVLCSEILPCAVVGHWQH